MVVAIGAQESAENAEHKEIPGEERKGPRGLAGRGPPEISLPSPSKVNDVTVPQMPQLYPVSMAPLPGAGQVAPGPEMIQENSYPVMRPFHVVAFSFLQNLFSLQGGGGTSGAGKKLSMVTRTALSYPPNQHNHSQRCLLLAKVCPTIFRVPKPIQRTPRTQFPQGTRHPLSGNVFSEAQVSCPTPTPH